MKYTLCRAATLTGLSLGALGAGIAVNSVLPRRFATWYTPEDQFFQRSQSSLPAIDITILRCASVVVPEWIAVRGAFSFALRQIAHSAVLIRHPKATFLYDTGIASTINRYFTNQSFRFKQTLGKFTMEQPLASHLQQLSLQPSDLDFVLISHLHWDHVSGVPDLPHVPLRINRVEYKAAQYGLLDLHHGLVRNLLGSNPIELFDCNGPAHGQFHSSYDLFGDGSLVLIPLPGHTAGNTGMLISRSNGRPLFLVGDAVWVAENFQRPATMHPFIWNSVTSDDATACQTLIDLHSFAHRHPDIPLVAMHDAAAQEAFMMRELVAVV
jgi:glyoxylase-like metal-dependent hydrolase (beta-lactamase superfamily II)